jgi:hypothetical protein
MLSSPDTAEMSSVMLTSNCTPAQSEGVLVALIEELWQAPLEQLQAPSPGTPDGVLSAEAVQTAQTGCACGCHAGLGLRLGRSRIRHEPTLRAELKCVEITDDTVERS